MTVGHLAVEIDVEATGPADPFQLAVEDEQSHDAEPEDRHRISDEADDPHDMVQQAVAIDRRPDAERDAEDDADDDADGGELGGGRKHAADIVQHRLRGQDRHAEIAVQHLPGIDQELVPDGQIEAHLRPHLVVGRQARPVADGGEHGVDRHQPPDDEGDEKQAEEGDEERKDQAAPAEEPASQPVKGGDAVLGR